MQLFVTDIFLHFYIFFIFLLVLATKKRAKRADNLKHKITHCNNNIK